MLTGIAVKALPALPELFSRGALTRCGGRRLPFHQQYSLEFVILMFWQLFLIAFRARSDSCTVYVPTRYAPAEFAARF